MKDVNQIMSDIMKINPDLTNSQICLIADQIEPLPEYVENLTDLQLLQLLGVEPMTEEETERFYLDNIAPYTKDSIEEIKQTILSPNYFQKEETK